MRRGEHHPKERGAKERRGREREKKLAGRTNLVSSTEGEVEVICAGGWAEGSEVEDLRRDETTDDCAEAEAVLPRVTEIDDIDARSALGHRAAPEDESHLSVLHGHVLGNAIDTCVPRHDDCRAQTNTTFFSSRLIQLQQTAAAQPN